VKQVPLGKTETKTRSVVAIMQVYAEIVLTPETILKLRQAAQ